MFGKLMSISDELMKKYYLLLSRRPSLEVDGIIAGITNGSLHPMEAKKTLAAEITGYYHGEAAGKEEREKFEARFSKKQIPDDAAVKYHWANSKGKKIEYKPSMDINSILPGMVFFYLSKDQKTGGYPGHGHTGIILSVDKVNKTWTSVEGNSNPLDGSREGYGTFMLTRKIADPSISKDPKDHPAKLLGFIDYFSPYRTTADFTKNLSDKMKTLLSELLPKTNKEIQYLKSNPEVLKDYEENYNNRNKS
jgi:hypothetical protein